MYLHGGGRDIRDRRRIHDALTVWLVASIRTGARSGLRDEVKQLARALQSADGERLRAEIPLMWGRLDALAGLATEAALSTGPNAVEAAMRDHPTDGQRLLELLAVAPEDGLLRADLRVRLGIADSQLSLMLSDFEPPGLVERVAEGRAIRVRLGAEGSHQGGRALAMAHATERAAVSRLELAREAADEAPLRARGKVKHA